jgi:hypothetical protein
MALGETMETGSSPQIDIGGAPYQRPLASGNPEKTWRLGVIAIKAEA